VDRLDPDAAARDPVLAPGAAAALVFGAAAAVLVLEILALRMLAPYVGLTLETSTTVIGVVLGGIAAGSAAGGSLADRGDPRTVLAAALLVGGLLAMLTVPLVRLLGDALEDTGEVAALPVALAAFFPPAAVLSAVTPATAKLQLGSLSRTGSVVGRLSAWATAGALVGTFAAGYALVPLLPTPATVLALGAVLVVAGIVAALRLRLLGPRSLVAIAIVAVMAVAASLALGDRCDAESAYYCAEVIVDEERPSGRILVLDDVTHSYVDLDDPRHLGFPYTRWMAPAIKRLPAAGGRFEAVFIGGGGFTLPRYLETTRPGSRSRVLEVDGELVELARERLGLRTTPALTVREGDARLTLRDEAGDSADLVVGDAFSGRAVPWHLTTREFMRDVRRVLHPGGIYAMNVIDQGPLRLARAEVATLLAEFQHVAVAARPGPGGMPRGGNLVLLASEQPLPRSVLPSETDLTVLLGNRVREFAGDSDALIDDHAPADQLLSPRS
jgi:spermidine synthase